MSTAYEPRNAHLICDLLYSALKEEEEDIRKRGGGRMPIDLFFASVAFATELYIGYLVRKEALRRGIPVSCELPCADKALVDLAFFEDDACTAICEIKRRGIWEDKGPLRDDVQKVLAQPMPHAVRRYNGWVLVLNHETRPDLKRWVQSAVIGKSAEIDEWEPSPTIPVNRTAGAVTVWNEQPHEHLQVVVFSVRK
jgi:hypothetical protein